MRVTILLSMLLTLITFSAQAITIDFEADTLGAKTNGFNPVGNTDISFSDTSGAGLNISDITPTTDGQGLIVGGSGTSQLQIDLSEPVTNFMIEFGIADPNSLSLLDIAVLQGFSGGSLAATIIVLLDADNILNQTAAIGGATIDQAFFFFANISNFLQPINLIEVVDNISFDVVNVAAVPLPAALPLFGTGLALMGFIGWRRKRQTA